MKSKQPPPPRYVSQLNDGDEFEAAGEQYRLLYLVGDSRAHVQLLKTSHVVIGAGTAEAREFDRPGARVNISVGTEITKILRRSQ